LEQHRDFFFGVATDGCAGGRFARRVIYHIWVVLYSAAGRGALGFSRGFCKLRDSFVRVEPRGVLRRSAIAE
jgi:hypothetical protein